MPRATLRDVAERAGVHVATASRALNEASRHMVRADTLERVLAVAGELGYRTNMTARTLRTARSGVVGMLVPDITNPIFPPMVRGVEGVLRARGYSTWVVNTDEDETQNEWAVSAFQQHSVDGFILATARLEDPLVDRMHDARASTPFVLANRRAARPDVPSVCADETESVRLAMQHLVDLEHEDVVLVAGPRRVSTAHAVERAFSSELAAHDLPRRRAQVTRASAYSVAAGHQALRRRLRADDDRFTAIVAGNDLIALGCLDALAEAGVRCPHDVSVIGFNDMLFMDRIAPALTTVAIPHHEIGAEAARLLVDVLDGASWCGASVVLPPSLVVRESTRCAPGRRARR